MSDRRINLVLLVAVVVALGSGIGVFSLLSKARASAAPTRTVVVATGDIPDGRVLTPEDVQLAALPDAAVPDSAFTTPDSVIGRVTRIPVLAGEPLVPARLAPMGAGGGLEVRIGRGKRAMPVRIEDAAASVIQPNSRVDVILVTTSPNGVPGGARLILANKRVLSVGGQMERAAPSAPSPTPVATLATLEVTPSEAERLALAMTTGRIQFVLRGYGDADDDPSVEESTSPPSPPTRVERAQAPSARPAIGWPRGTRARTWNGAGSNPAPGVTPATEPAGTPDRAPERTPTTPRRPDTATVQVFRRGGAVTNLTFPRKDTIRP